MNTGFSSSPKRNKYYSNIHYSKKDLNINVPDESKQKYHSDDKVNYLVVNETQNSNVPSYNLDIKLDEEKHNLYQTEPSHPDTQPDFSTNKFESVIYIFKNQFESVKSEIFDEDISKDDNINSILMKDKLMFAIGEKKSVNNNQIDLNEGLNKIETIKEDRSNNELMILNNVKKINLIKEQDFKNLIPINEDKENLKLNILTNSRLTPKRKGIAKDIIEKNYQFDFKTIEKKNDLNLTNDCDKYYDYIKMTKNRDNHLRYSSIDFSFLKNEIINYVINTKEKIGLTNLGNKLSMKKYVDKNKRCIFNNNL